MRRYPHYIIEVARALRQRQTPAETLLWQRLRRRQLDGLKFRRQHHFGRYIADFYCAELNLIVECEGGIHDKRDQQEYDQHRFEELDARGLTVLRVKNSEVLDKLDDVLQRILSFKRTQ